MFFSQSKSTILHETNDAESLPRSKTSTYALPSEHYKRISRVTGPADNSKEFILLNGHVEHKMK